MAVIRIVLLLMAVVGAILRPFRLSTWVVPMASAALPVMVGAILLTGAHDALDPLAEPIAFLLVAVPLAVLLDVEQ